MSLSPQEDPIPLEAETCSLPHSMGRQENIASAPTRIKASSHGLQYLKATGPWPPYSQRRLGTCLKDPKSSHCTVEMGTLGKVHAYGLMIGPQLQVSHTESVPPSSLSWVPNLRKGWSTVDSRSLSCKSRHVLQAAYSVVTRVTLQPLSLQPSKCGWLG